MNWRSSTVNTRRGGGQALCTFLVAAIAVLLPNLHQAESPHAAFSKSMAPISANSEVTDCEDFLPYATDPSHTWNRVHRQLLDRHDKNDKIWGCDDVDPLLWQQSTHLLSSPAYPETVRLLDEFTSTRAEGLIRDPLPRVLFQRDLLAVFEWLGRSSDDHPQERAALERRLAVIIKAVALTSLEIQGLPDDYADLRGSTTSDGLALPDKASGWLLMGRDAGTPVAPMHSSYFSRSMFLVYLRLPPGGTRAPKYVECSPPQFPVGTELALVRRAILMDATGRPLVSSITESVQLRRYVSIPAGTRFDFNGSTQDVAEFQLTRSALLQGKISLRRIGKDETQFPVLATHGSRVQR